MSRYIIEGGAPLRGMVDAAASKNAVLPIMAATLLTDDECVLTNVPQIRDVVVMGNLLTRLGARVEGLGTSELRISCRDVETWELSTDLVRRMRASVVLMAPLLARMGRVRSTMPGGCVLGRRGIDTHLSAMEALGATVKLTHDGYDVHVDRLHGKTIFLDEASVTATENTVMAACLAQGRTVIKHAASEPHVQDFCQFLVKMGASIQGIGSNVLTVDGVAQLSGARHAIVSDYLDVGTFAVAAAVTQGDVLIRNVVHDHIEIVTLCLQSMGVNFEAGPDTLRIRPSVLRATRKIATGPFPAFPTDLASLMIVAATQADGMTLVHDWMYEGRMFFTDKLVNMGANIVLCDPHRCVVTGRTPLLGRTTYSPDIRAGAALVLAALAAQGTSEIHDVELVERGYEHFADRIAALGGNIQKVD